MEGENKLLNSMAEIARGKVLSLTREIEAEIGEARHRVRRARGWTSDLLRLCDEIPQAVPSAALDDDVGQIESAVRSLDSHLQSMLATLQWSVDAAETIRKQWQGVDDAAQLADEPVDCPDCGAAAMRAIAKASATTSGSAPSRAVD